MANSFKGKIYAVEGIQTIQREGKEPFQKRRVALDATRFDGLTGERGREKYVVFEFFGKNATIPDGFQKGDVVEIFFDVDSQLVQKKDGTKDWFTRVSGYKIERLAAHAPQPSPQPQVQAQPQQYPPYGGQSNNQGGNSQCENLGGLPF